MTTAKILIVDDEAEHRVICQELLQAPYLEIVGAASGEEALNLLTQERFDVIISDLLMPGMSGLDLLAAIKRNGYNIPVIIVTGYPNMDNAETCVNMGSFEYIAKPYDPYVLQATLQRALQGKNKKSGTPKIVIAKKRKGKDAVYHFPNIIGQSAKMQEIFAKVTRVAESSTNVCIYGESGTGKELIARAIHYNSLRQDRPLVTLDCTAIPEGLMESEMFGHVRGAFTSAVTNREGVFELAHKGTLFLDEIGELSLPLQAKLLRVIQSQEFRKVGGTKPIKVDVRIIAATNKNLRKAVQERTFREDLFFRINVLSFSLPSLRERKEDIPLLVDFFIEKFNRTNKKRIKGINPAALSVLLQYDWPGNVRELENRIESLVVMTEKDWITVEDLVLLETTAPEKDKAEQPTEQFQSLAQVEQAYIHRVLHAVGGNKRHAARILRISPATLYYKLRQTNIPVQFKTNLRAK